MPNDDTEYYDELLEALDKGPWDLTGREEEFLAMVLAQDGPLSQRQKERLTAIAKKYGV